MNSEHFIQFKDKPSLVYIEDHVSPVISHSSHNGPTFPFLQGFIESFDSDIQFYGLNYGNIY